MKYFKYLSILSLFTLGISCFAFAGQSNPQLLKATHVTDFGNKVDEEKGVVWKAKFSPFIAKNVPNGEVLDPVENTAAQLDTELTNLRYVKSVPSKIVLDLRRKVQDMYNTSMPSSPEAAVTKTEEEKWLLGVKATFTRTGYNWIELIPYKGTPEKNEDPSVSTTQSIEPQEGDEVNPFTFNSVVDRFVIWVWGGQFEYALDLIVKDALDMHHPLHFGRINHLGWKSMEVKVPEAMLQSRDRIPFLNPISVEMLKLWSSPAEPRGTFYAYFDRLVAYLDLTKAHHFDGDNLESLTW